MPDTLWVFLIGLVALTSCTGVALWSYGNAVFHRTPYGRFPMEVFPFNLAYDASEVASKAARESRVRLSRGDADGALRAADIALSHNGHLAYAHLHRSEALASLGRGAEALDSAQEAVKSGPHVLSALLWLAHLLCGEGRRQEALTAVDKALEMEPRYLQALLLRCRLLEELGQDVQQLETINLILGSSVDVVGLWLRGKYLCRRGDRRGLDDLSAAKRSGRIRPNAARAAFLVDRAKALLSFRESGARSDAEVALLLAPDSVDAKAAVALCDLMEDKFLAAVERLNGILQDVTLPEAVRADHLSNRAGALLALGEIERAQADVAEALSVAKPTQFAQSLAAELALLQGRHQEALDMVLDIQQQSPRYLRAAEIAAKAYEALGDSKNTVQQYSNFIRYADDWQTELEPHLPERIERARARVT